MSHPPGTPHEPRPDAMFTVRVDPTDHVTTESAVLEALRAAYDVLGDGGGSTAVQVNVRSAEPEVRETSEREQLLETKIGVFLAEYCAPDEQDRVSRITSDLDLHGGITNVRGLLALGKSRTSIIQGIGTKSRRGAAPSLSVLEDAVRRADLRWRQDPVMSDYVDLYKKPDDAPLYVLYSGSEMRAPVLDVHTTREMTIGSITKMTDAELDTLVRSRAHWGGDYAAVARRTGEVRALRNRARKFIEDFNQARNSQR